MRMGPTRWVARFSVAAVSASIAVVATGAIGSPASADMPVKVGWWNFASGGGTAAPAPDTKPGGLRVGVSSSQPLAIGAVEYNLPRDGSATLELAVTSITSNANAPLLNNILACPTTSDSWKAGDDQDSSTAPAYSCDGPHFVGRLSSDQATMTFLVDGAADVSDGVLSLAIVPAHSTAIPVAGTDPGTGTDLTPPFVVEFDKPGSNSLVSDDGSSSSSSGGSSAPPPPPSTTDTGSASGGASSTPSFPAPPASGDVSVPSTPSDAGAGASPVVAPQQPASTGQTTPAAAVTPAKSDNSKHDLLLVLLVLLLFAILYTQNAQQRAPRRVGAAAADGADAGAAAALPVPYPAGYAPRGLGRFAKPRTQNARPLI